MEKEPHVHIKFDPFELSKKEYNELKEMAPVRKFKADYLKKKILEFLRNDYINICARERSRNAR